MMDRRRLAEASKLRLRQMSPAKINKCHRSCVDLELVCLAIATASARTSERVNERERAIGNYSKSMESCLCWKITPTHFAITNEKTLRIDEAAA